MTSKDLFQFKVIGLAIALGLFLNAVVMLLNQGLGTPAYAAEGAGPRIQKVMLVDSEGNAVNQKVTLVDPVGRPINSYGMKFGDSDKVYLGLMVGGKMEMGLDEAPIEEPAPETP